MVKRGPASPSNSAWLTRRKIIDPKLKAAGWRVVGTKDFDSTKPLEGEVVQTGERRGARFKLCN